MGLNLNNIFADIMDMHPSGIAVYDEEGRFSYANESYIKNYNIDQIDKNLSFESIKPCSYGFDHIKSKLLNKQSFSVQGQEDSAWFESIFFYTKSKYLIHISSNITTIKEADQKIYYHANYDSLTALPNRSFFEKKLTKTLEESSQNGSSVALFFIDIDKFKEVNDTFGHSIGDKMLSRVAKRLLNNTRKDDIVARIGGDEFILIIKNIADTKSIEKLAANLQKKIREPLEIDTHIFNITLSMGISIYPQHGSTADELLKNADIAMYEVKKSKRDGFKIYNRLMSSKAETKLMMQSEIKKALEQDEFVMYYQPIINFSSNAVIGAEAFVRWKHLKKGIVEPNDFLELVISADIEKEFGCMVISKVLEDLTRVNKTFLNNKLVFSVNVSKNQLFNQNFCSDIAKISKNYNIDRSQIELKLVENQIMQDVSKARKKIENLHNMGFKVVLDDYGMEHSSLNNLKFFKVNKLKIDKSFIKNMAQDESDLNIVKSIVNTAKLFNLKVQAEGIEKEDQYAKLKDMGCDYSQGFYHSSALPLDDFIHNINNTNRL